ncbi:MAG: DNA-processing protein DprA [Candidatus Latescibacteria bacterium]|nr:DNA-processing protein DprA [Candidatus Latescibacterota bacterium]
MSFLFIDLFDIPRMTEAKLKNLLQEFQTPEAIFNAEMQDLLNVKGIDNEIAGAIKNYKQSKETEEKYQRAEQLGIKTVSYLDVNYPKNLKNISHAPPVLFIRGEIKQEDEKALGIIGTRLPTAYGKMVAEKFAYELAQMGITIVSGLARGIDTAAHLGALKAKSRTIAVLGCGVDIYYPPENKRLYDQISQNGAVISEFNLGTTPFAMNFPKRNRIISGLSLGILAVEAPANSGVLNTVTWAADQGREVFAVPGAINQKSSIGTNQLIKDGVKPVTSVEDICQELDIAFEKKEKKDIPVTELEKQILDFLSAEPLYPDEIVDKLKQPMSVLLPQLLSLEIKGLIKQLPGNKYIKTF